MCRAAVGVLLSVLLAAPAFAQSQAANGSSKARCPTRSGACCRASPSRSPTLTPATSARSSRNDDGVYRAPLLPLGRYRVVAELQGFKNFEQTGHHALGRADRGRSTSRWRSARVAKRSPSRASRRSPSPGKIDLGRTIGETEIKNLPLVAQPLQLRVPAGQRHRLREQRVRRAAHQRERHADAHELPDRRQHQHREGPRRPAPAAGLRSAGARGEGHHQRLRARVRPDDRHGLQRDHAVGHQRPARLGELPLPRNADVVAAVLPRRRPRASPTPRSTTSRRRSAGRS